MFCATFKNDASTQYWRNRCVQIITPLNHGSLKVRWKVFILTCIYCHVAPTLSIPWLLFHLFGMATQEARASVLLKETLCWSSYSGIFRPHLTDTSQHYFFCLSVQGTGSILKVSSYSSLDWYKKKTLWSLSAVDKPKSMGRPPDHPCWKTGLPESFLGCPNYFDLSLRQNLNVFYWTIFPLIESWVAHRET